MWSLQKTKSGNAHVVENVYDIISGAAAQFDAGQFEHLTVLIKETWQASLIRNFMSRGGDIHTRSFFPVGHRQIFDIVPP